ncbi:unnamed protein product [Auanema sp. JU1783]|nr:unnamed protein product [Auanema sp. JU1783]
MNTDYEFLDRKPPLSAMGQVVESIGMDSESQGKCGVCSQHIKDKFIMKIDNTWHHEVCCQCSVCGINLEDKCHEKDGQLYCQEHYYRECSQYRCAGCQRGIAPCDMVYKLRATLVFHVNCHSCCRCGRLLSPGEQILVDEAAKTVACMSHMYEEQQNVATSSATSYPSCSSEATPYSMDSYSEYNIKKEIDPYGYNFEGFSFSDFCDDDGKFLKRRGPRTTIKQNQLDVLNRIFSTTPKPSKHARAKLALETGLSMRVIQVWFQNRRSKERRLKHLCNYLRHYEQRGLIPPPIPFANDATACDSSAFNQMMNGMDNNSFDEEDDED